MLRIKKRSVDHNDKSVDHSLQEKKAIRDNQSRLKVKHNVAITYSCGKNKPWQSVAVSSVARCYG